MHVLGSRSRFRSLAVVCLVVVGLGACSGDDDDDGDDGAQDETSETTEASEESAEGEDASVFDVAVGDCLSEDVTGDSLEEVPVVACDQPHTSEVYFGHTIEEESFPGPDGMQTVTQEECLPAFESFVGVAYDASELEVTTLEPTAESWDQGDRELLCLVVDPAGEVTGTLEGANR